MMQDRLRNLAISALIPAGADATDAGLIEFTVPVDAAHGDLTTNAALIFAKKLNRPPRELATLLAAALGEADDVATAAAAGPGFVNLRLADDFIMGQVRRALDDGDRYGSANSLAGQNIQVEFVSANPTGPLNAVSARAAAYGDALARLLSFLGANLQREFLVNDVGTQIDLLAQSVRARAKQARGEDAAVPPEGYAGDYVIALAGELGATGDVIAEDDDALGARAADAMVARQREDLAAFGVTFDRWFRQRELYPEKIEAARKALESRGAVYEKDGATWLRTTAGGDDEDRVIVRADGRATYYLADIAYHLDKFDRGFTKVINVLGPDHHGHLKKMYAMARLLGMPETWLEIVISQQVNLLEEGVKVKMSKRAGNLVTMHELTENIGVDAARYFFLMRSHSAHLDFDLELARKQSPENPVYYAQYCHARVESVKREAGAPAGDADLTALDLDDERLLARRIWEFPQAVALAATLREPHHLTAYVGKLAAQFHNYYHHHRILQAPSGAKVAARLALASAVGQTVKNALSLLGVSAPERM